MEQGRPEPLQGIADIGETKDVQHHSAEAHHTKARNQDAVEGGANAANAEFVQGAAPVQPVAQAGVALHETLQKGGDRHQPQAAGDDQDGKGDLAEGGEVAAHVNYRQAGHRDGGGHGEQGLPQPYLIAGAERAGDHHGADHDHQGTGDDRELGNGELLPPSQQVVPGGEGRLGGHGTTGGEQPHGIS